MTNREFFIKRWKSEQKAFVNVLRALPDGRLDYKPHEKSAGAGDLAWQLAEEARSLAEVTDAGEIALDMTPRPATAAAIAGAFEKHSRGVVELLGKVDERRWDSDLKFIMGGKAVWTTNFGEMFWGFLFDMVHHRGQLSTYIRPMGGKVPSIYGPSADDPGE